MQNRRFYLAVAAFIVAVSLLLFFRSGHDSRRSQSVSLGERSGQAGVSADSAPADKTEDGAPEDSWTRYRWEGDYPEMVKRRMIRVLVPPSKTFFFLDKGKKRGLTYESMRAFESFVNSELKSRHVQVKVIILPTSRKRLLEDLRNGYGDIAAGNLTITPRRKELVDFTDPLMIGVDEILVTGRTVPAPETIFDLAGKEVFVRRSSSYYESLVLLNNTLNSLGKKPVIIRQADEYLEDEDLLEMVNADLIPMIVIDNHKGKLWAQVFKNIRLHPNLKLRTDGKIAWAIRKNTPKLKELLDRFVSRNKKGTLTGNILYRRYLENAGYVKNSLNKAARKKYEQTISLFKKYASKYEFPYLLLTALAYQESGLDQKKRSQAGAVGIMQVLPSTARDKNVGIDRIDLLENNIHAGAKYLHFLKNRYFSDGTLDKLNSNLFTVASYNAGPNRVAELRKEAGEKGFDPDIWFNNVEIIAARRIGRETVQYVANIYKYYVAYKYIVEQTQKKKIGKEILQKHYMSQ